MNSSQNENENRSCPDPLKSPIFVRLLERYPLLNDCAPEIASAAGMLLQTAHEGGKYLLCGNGGSAADADHITGELLKSFCKKRPVKNEIAEKLRDFDRVNGGETGALLAEKLQSGLPAIALTYHNALSTAFANDVDPNLIFAQQCLAFGKPGDLLWGITCSGNAKNVYCAALTARAAGLKVLGLTGKSGGRLKAVCDVCIRVPCTETWEVQELHLPVYHAICLYLEDQLW
ncbi:MAG: SIS domain-containing protein [Treponema sp.]|nr:SIS domain-containing protein [Treponema sp.]